jgi:putative cell wall-binding protein
VFAAARRPLRPAPTPSAPGLSALVALVVLLATTAVVGPARAQDFSVTVDPTAGLEAEDEVTVTLSGTPAGQGLYVRLCVEPEPGGRPTACDGAGMWATLPPGSPAVGGTFAPAEGTFTLPVREAFGEVDCTAVQCGIHTRRDHNDGADTALDRFVPITFASGAPGGARDVGRIAGDDRFATAAAVAAAFEPGGTVVVGSGEGFADALAGGAAAVQLAGPLLLVARDVVPAPTRGALEALAPDRILLLGGESAVSPAVEAELAGLAPTTRLSAADRYGTAAAVAAEVWPEGAIDVLVASGESHADALAGGAAAGSIGSPLLLVARDVLPDVVRAELERLGPQRITVLGGAGAVSAAVQQELQQIAPTTRIEGTSREATAASIATTLWSSGTRRVVVVGGDGFADGLAAAPLAGRVDGPVLLVGRDVLPDVTADALGRLGATSVTVVGGPGAVADEVLAALAQG